ncbi:MAG: DNA polymerase IV, partial [Clostridia bacterium]|nr:DNA polymerase IV [Clostridia bacterium]
WIRGNDLSGCQFQCKLPVRTQLPSEIAAAGFGLFKERYKWNKKVRAVCIRAIDLVPEKTPEQLTMFDDATLRDKRERIQDAVESIRSRFGKRAVTYAILLGDLKMPDDGRDTVRMPGLMYQ